MAELPVPGFADALRRLRADAGLTQEELAEAARLSPRTVSDLERGVNRAAHKGTAELLADALGLAGPVRGVFVAAARGRVPAAEVLAARAEALDAFAGNLPVQVSSFIGRDRELSEVRALVASSRLVTLTGTGGCGKTRLSLQVAAELLDRPSDGVWLVELAAVTGQDAVAPAICEALAIVRQPGRQALDTLLSALATQDVLIVIDNCEHLIGACAKTADAILRHCPNARLVATSREPLGISGEAIYRVPPLSLPRPGDRDSPAPEPSDAVALFVERAKEQGAGLSADDQTSLLIASICVRLDGMPLAIELAAARLRSLSLSVLNDRIDQRFRLLTGEAVPPRRGSGPCGRPSTGPIHCSMVSSSCCCGACRCSPAVLIWTPPKRSAASATSRRSTSPTFLARWWTRAWSWPSRLGQPSAIDYWKPSASTPPSGSPKPTTARQPPSGRRTARTICRSLRRQPLT